MKVLLIAHASYLQPDRVVSGNSVRAYYLAHGLVHHGIDVVHVYPSILGALESFQSSLDPGISLRVYKDSDELIELIEQENPDILLVGYWELLDELPDNPVLPVVLDLVAPRILEIMYEPGRSLDDEIQHMLMLYRKVDRFLVGNERQRDFLLPWLIMAGFDCRETIPIDIVPISTSPCRSLSSEPHKQRWRFIAGGVSWPWRRTENYFDALIQGIQHILDGRGELVLLSGQYVYDPLYGSKHKEPSLTEKEKEWPEQVLHRYSLQPYGELEEFLRNHCDIAIELADQNIERNYSQSFRAVEFLRCGLPLVCNDYLALAKQIRKYDAGWVIQSPTDIPKLLQEISSFPEHWIVKSKNAIRLVNEEFNYIETIFPLVNFIRQPHRPIRGEPLLSTRRMTKITAEITHEYEQIVRERAQIASERDQIAHERNQIAQEHDRILREKDKLVQERNILAKSLKEREKELSQARQHTKELVSTITALQQSHSWRFTAPLRIASTWIHRRLHKITVPWLIAAKGVPVVAEASPSSQRFSHSVAERLRGKSRRWPAILAKGFRDSVGVWHRKRHTKKVVVIVSRADIFPTDHGAAVKIDRTACNLSQLIDAVYLVTDSRCLYYEYKNGNCIKKRYPLWIKLTAPSRNKVRNDMEQIGIPQNESFLYFPLSDWSYIVRTIFIAFKYGVTAFQAEFPTYARACIWGRNLFGGKVLLVEHNIEYQRLKEQYSNMLTNTYTFLRQMELTLCNHVDAVITVSELDRRQLIQGGIDEQRLHIIPHGVDLERFSTSQPLDLRGMFNIPSSRSVLVYHGIYSYAPNLEAMRVMAQEILPRLHAKGVYPKVLAIGRAVPGIQLHKDIIFTGSVERIEPYLLAADIAVVPLLQGGGTRMKILDYFAASLPVISTSKGIEGISIENGVHAIIEDNYEQFADAITKLLNDSKQARQIGANGHAVVVKQDWKAIAYQYVQLMN